MEIRKFIQDDLSGICKLINSELGYNISNNDLGNRILQMQEANNYCIFVALEKNQVIGFIGTHIGLAFEISGKVMRIIALAVNSDYQKMGIGKRLIQEAEQFAIQNDVTVISVNSGLARTGAHIFYEKQNFHKKGFSFCKKI